MGQSSENTVSGADAPADDLPLLSFAKDHDPKREDGLVRLLAMRGVRQRVERQPASAVFESAPESTLEMGLTKEADAYWPAPLSRIAQPGSGGHGHS